MTVVLDDTIAAVATPLFPAGIGVIRISGPEAIKIANAVFAGKKQVLECETYTALHGYIKNPETVETLDEAVCLVMKGPASYTGEDVVELSLHGSPLVLRKTLEMIIRLGARQAEAGEFTYRAYLNGKLSLTEAEAIHKLVKARSESGLRNAFLQMQGSLRRNILELRTKVQEVLSNFEAEIEFPAEELNFLSKEDGLKHIKHIITACSKMIETYQLGKQLEEGVKIVICGPPNSGKSTLLNRLLKDDRAIVHEIPGTTRDKVEGTLSINGAVIKIIDTAGIRLTENAVEKIGITKTIEAIKKSNVIIWLESYDTKSSFKENELKSKVISKSVKKHSITVMNKIDLLDKNERKTLQKKLKSEIDIFISAKKGWGVKQIYMAIEEVVGAMQSHSIEGTIITSLRQEQLLKECRKALNRAENGLKIGVSLEYICQDINEGIEALNQLIGTKPRKDIYELVFKHFCIGK
jgi:tRNA modification GTPase